MLLVRAIDRMTFSRLRTKLTVLYMGLFGVALILVAIAVVTAVRNSARLVVRDELSATGAVYGQIWATRSDQLRQGAAVLAQDFGFREAVATDDEDTIRSALENLRARQNVDGAMILSVDGAVVATGVHPDDAAIDTLWNGLSSQTVDNGVVSIGGEPFQVVAAPIRAPVIIGWVVFAKRLDAIQMRDLEGLSAIPLSASVLVRDGAGWQGALRGDKKITAAAQAGLSENAAPELVHTGSGPSMVLAKRLPSFDDKAPAALLLTYPLNRAMQPYDALFGLLALIGAVGLGLVMAGTWALSRTLTRPISALDDAVQRLRQGEYSDVAVTSDDEIGRLASSFNTMADGIRQRETQLTHMALHDQETDLPNRRWLEQSVVTRPEAWLVLFGIERFEVVRNAIGYDSMADLVVMLGRRLSMLAAAEDVARVGAGALGLIIEAADATEAMDIARRLAEAAEAPVKLNGAAVDIAVTAGVACCALGLEGSIPPVDRAAIAIDQARAARAPCAVFDAAAYGDPGDNLSLISELLNAMKTGEVSLAYQPKYDFRQERIGGVEALARWLHPRRGFVSPDLFVGMAEETGHIRPLTEWVVRQAINDQKVLAEAGHDLVMAINISGRLLSDQSFADFALNEAAVSGAKLCFEITETAVIDNPEIALAIIDRFAEAGIAVSIDDYGSGLSSLAYLKRIKADELKIDKSFILTLDQSSRDALLVKSTIDLAHSLGMKVTAEGVETPTALALLRGMGCDVAQGYLIGRPAKLDALIAQMNDPAALIETAQAPVLDLALDLAAANV